MTWLEQEATSDSRLTWSVGWPIMYNKEYVHIGPSEPATLNELLCECA